MDDASAVQPLHFYATRAMDHAPGVNHDAHMAYLAVLMVEENEVSGLCLLQTMHLFSLRSLFACVAQQRPAEKAHDDLREAGAVHTKRILPAP